MVASSCNFSSTAYSTSFRAELSDGTLCFLLWAAALLTPRPPELMVLNEPETGLHPNLLPALARLIVAAAKHTQIIVTLILEFAA